MADGTFASYQGRPLARATFIRTRGWGADISVVEIHVGGDLPNDVLPPPPARLYETVVRGQGRQSPPPSPNLPAVAPAESGISSLRLPPGQPPLQACGTLILMEVVNDRPYFVVAPGLFIVRSETIRANDRGTVERVRLVLADIRYFFVRGLLARWSFNRRLPDGFLAKDSVRPDGALFTLFEIIRGAAAQLPSSPRVTAGPARWENDRGAVELPPFDSALHALQTLVKPAGLEEPALRLDGSLAFHQAGDGMVGYAEGGAGRNDSIIPLGFIQSRDGAGHGRVLEPGYPEEVIVVTGGETIATTAMDDCEPVLILPGDEVRPLTEELVRRLTDGRFGLDWLMRFVLRPAAYQNVAGVDPEVLDLFADQAGKCFRIPGVEVRRANPAAAQAQAAANAGRLAGGVLTPQAQAALAREADSAAPLRDVIEPGPNAHLLPLLDRAEAVAGQRLPVLVEAFGYTSVHQNLLGTPSQEAYQIIVRELGRLYDTAPGVAGRDFESPFAAGPAPPLNVGDLFNSGKGANALAAAKAAGVTLDELQAAMTKARNIEALRSAGPESAAHADALKRLELEKAELQSKLGGAAGQKEVLEAGFAIVAQEKALDDDINSLEWLSGDFIRDKLDKRQGTRDEILAALRPLFEKINGDRAEQAKRTAAGLAPNDEKPLGRVVLVNRLRRVDPDARVYDRLGVVKLSSHGGHVDPDRAVDESYPTLVLKPVRVSFGCVVRPRLDVPPGAVVAPEPPRTTVVNNGPDGGAGRDFQVGAGGESKIPGALSDVASVFAVAFERIGRAALQEIPLDRVPFERAVAIHDPDLVRLIPLEGEGNIADLKARALQKARERANVPDMVRTERICYARPWPVQCDGVVASVTITMREKDGVPCGFDTIVQTGCSAAALTPAGGATTVRDPARVGAAAARAGFLP